MVRGVSTKRRIEVIAQAIDVRLEWWRERIHPVLCAEEIFQALGWQHILDSKRKDRQLLVHGPFYFAPHLARFVAAAGENQNHQPRTRNRIDDFRGPVGGRGYVARRDPYTHAAPLHSLHQRERRFPIRLRIAYEEVVCHGSATQHPQRLVQALAHAIKGG